MYSLLCFCLSKGFQFYLSLQRKGFIFIDILNCFSALIELFLFFVLLSDFLIRVVSSSFSGQKLRLFI